VVTIPPVYITGDASQQLARRYDERAAEACKNERNGALASCPNIAAAVVDSGPLTAHVASLVCAQLITVYDSCRADMVGRLKSADQCEAKGQVAVPGTRPHEAYCVELPE
jgi:hypothetical protein